MEKRSLFDIFFSQEFEGWSEKFNDKKKLIKKSLDLVDNYSIKYEKFYPLREDVFKFLHTVPLKDIKVIIWGHRPYSKHFYKRPRALGYAYGVSKDDNLTSSLRNIYTKISQEFPLTYKSPLDKDNFYNGEEKTLEYLHKQGVLLINKILMECVENKDGFEDIWNRFIFIIIEIINENIENCVHVLLGKSEKLSSLIKSKDIIVTPDPDSWKWKKEDCKVFSKINISLDKLGKEQIKWNIKDDDPNTKMV